MVASHDDPAARLSLWLFFGKITSERRRLDVQVSRPPGGRHERTASWSALADGPRWTATGRHAVHHSTRRQGCHTGHPEAFWRANRVGRRAALSITPYMNRAGYSRW
jgi:hypothetical protein